jgi:hypothetical protein
VHWPRTTNPEGEGDEMPYRPGVDEALCFVLMPFGSNFDAYYRDIIKEAVTDAGLSPLRADEVYGTSAIIQDIWNQIWRARIVVADVTSRNPNVAYELGICHALGVPTVIITQRIDDVPFDFRHIRCIVYETDKTRWERRLQDALRNTLVATLKDTNLRPDLPWPYDALGIEAGLDVRATRYKFSEVLDEKCAYVLMTGTNFGDQFGVRGDLRTPLLYDEIVHLLTTNDRATVQLTFAPPRLVKLVTPVGYKDLVEKSLPRMWDLANDSRLVGHRDRLRINTHHGALFMAAFVRDPNDPERALIITTPRWISDERGLGRMFVAIWKKERPELFRALWAEMEPSLRVQEGESLLEVIENLSRPNELGQSYGDFVRSGQGTWRLQDRRSARRR